MSSKFGKKQLFDEDSDQEEESLNLKTNKDYAKKFNSLREKELYKKLKEQDLENDGSGSDSSDSSTDEDEVNDPKFDEEFFKTLSSLKSKDPKIYDKESKFFNDSSSSDDEENGESKSKKQKPMTLNDFERKVIVEKGGKYVDDDDESEEERPFVNKFKDQDLTYVQEQNKLKEEFSKAINEEDSDEEFGGIFKKRDKSKEEKDKEEAEFAEWLAGRKGDDALKDEDAKKSLAPLKEYWNKPTLTSREKFLRDYILTKGYADAEHDEIPTYEEIVGDKEEDEKLSADEDELQKQAEFEHKFNFRYEEPDDDFIKRYPRTIDNSVRKQDTKRKQKRQETKDRKLKEKEEKMQQIEMLKELKRKEIQEKIDKLKMVAGQDTIPFNPDELDEDFDPEAHDRRMQELFNDEYYQVDEGEEKPECDIDELKFEDWDNYEATEGNDADEDGHCEDDDFNMDCDYDPKAAAEARKKSLQEELIENTTKKKRGRRNRFMEMIKSKKPVFDPEDEKTYSEYIDEYYKMDCEDIIGDTQCRFKYTECEPNDFGLTIEEILLAKNKELNQWASLKKAVQIRPEHLEKKEQRLYKLKAKNEELKRKIFKSLYDPSSDEEEESKKNTEVTLGGWEVTTNKKKKKKKKNKSSTETSETPENPPSTSKSDTLKRKAEPEQTQNDSQTFKKKKPNDGNNSEKLKNNKPNTEKSKPQNNNFKNKKPQNKNPFNKDGANGVSDDRLKAYGINPKKFHNQQKFGKNAQAANHKQKQSNFNGNKQNNPKKKPQTSNGAKKSKWD